jgi:hypothetical protein
LIFIYYSLKQENLSFSIKKRRARQEMQFQYSFSHFLMFCSFLLVVLLICVRCVQDVMRRTERPVLAFQRDVFLHEIVSALPEGTGFESQFFTPKEYANKLFYRALSSPVAFTLQSNEDLVDSIFFEPLRPCSIAYVLDESETSPVSEVTLSKLFGSNAVQNRGKNPFTNLPLRSIRKVRVPELCA